MDINSLKKLNIGEIKEYVDLKKYTTYKAGGLGRFLVIPDNRDSLIKLLNYIKKNNLKYKILGFGSNLIFSDSLYDGILIKLDNLNNVKINGTEIYAEAGYSLIKLSLLAARNSLAGLEFASGIPGSVGGAIFMNAGAYKSDMGYITKWVKVLTPKFEIIRMTNKELDFHYRTSFLQKHNDYICLEASLELRQSNRELLQEIVEDRRKRRVESQPLEFPSAGSVFRNPENMFAGKLIEDLGYKGYSIGGAKVSDKHANFIINYNNATSQDIKDLIDFVREKVKKEYNVELKVEQEFVNWE